MATETERQIALKIAENPEAALRALRMSLAEESLIDYTKAFWRVLEPKVALKIGWAIEAVSEHLEAVSNDQIDNLLINIPPGMMKSLMVNVFWPSWEWGPRNRPDLRYIFASYAASLSTRDNMKARDLVRSEQYRDWYGDRFSISHLEKNTEKEYHTDAKGFRFATGVDGALTGYRGDRLCFDDPHSVKGGDSDTDRKTAVRWLAETWYNRVNDIETAKRVGVMQRVHENDISGHILEHLSGDWEILCLPMRFEEDRRCVTSIGFKDPRTKEGELLFPERFPEKELTALENAMMSAEGEYAVASQMQQRPVPRDGAMFKTSELGECDVAPAGGRSVRGWDFAGSVRKDSPYTAGVKGKIVNGILYIEDVQRMREKIYNAEAAVVEICKAERHVRQSMPQDPGSSGLSQKHNLGKRLIGLDFLFSTESGSKEDRAIPLAAYVNAGNVVLVKGAWNAAFKAEMAGFPRGKFKDQIDAASRMFHELQRLPTAPSAGPAGGSVTADDD